MKRYAYFVSVFAATMTLSSPAVLAGEDAHSEKKDASMEVEAREAWREGKVESAFLVNTNLNNFKIDVEVEGEEATLEGFVATEAEKDLAEEIALGIDGIAAVDNKLKVDEQSAFERGEAAVKDAAITARVNVGLMANGELSALNIDVDTTDRVVTLKGEVSNDTEKDLAEKIAENVEEVRDVENELKIAGS